jgi:hypothetical protein
VEGGLEDVTTVADAPLVPLLFGSHQPQNLSLDATTTSRTESKDTPQKSREDGHKEAASEGNDELKGEQETGCNKHQGAYRQASEVADVHKYASAKQA